MILKQRAYDESSRNKLTEQACSPLIARILASRNIHSIDEISGKLKHLLPISSLKHVDIAANLIADHVEKNNQLLIVGDFDADGATSTAVFIRALRMIGHHRVNYLVPNRFEYGYGLSPELVEEAKKYAPDLLITVDNGISSFSGTIAAKQQGWDVLITDHHLPADELPEADVIVNPNQADDAFESKALAGVGVVFYVVIALKKVLTERGWFTTHPQPNLITLLDLVALGTVADVVSLDHNNRTLVDLGLKQIRRQQACFGIQALFEIAGKRLHDATTSDLSFACGPRLNAAGRLDDMSIGIECLLSEDLNNALTYAQMLDDYNQERKDLEITMKEQAFKQLAQWEYSQGKNLNELPNVICLYNENWHQGIIGILAARIKEKYNRPCIIFANASDALSNVLLKGSARSIHPIHIRDLLATLDTQYPETIVKFGGHAMAAGLSIEKERLEAFQSSLATIANQYCSPDMFTETLYTDGALTPEELSIEVAEQLRTMAPWGQHFPEPVFDGYFTIYQKKILKNKHLRLQLRVSSQYYDAAHEPAPPSLQAIAFNTDVENWPEQNETVHLLYQFDVNEFRGIRSPQLIIRKRLS